LNFNATGCFCFDGSKMESYELRSNTIVYELHFRMTELKEEGMEEGQKGGKAEELNGKSKKIRTMVDQCPKFLLLGVS